MGKNTKLNELKHLMFGGESLYLVRELLTNVLNEPTIRQLSGEDSWMDAVNCRHKRAMVGLLLVMVSSTQICNGVHQL